MPVAVEEDASLEFTLRANVNNSFGNEPGRVAQQVDMLSQQRPPMAASMINQPVMIEESPPGSHRVFSPPNLKETMYQ